ncbi:unnamed protein product, partial [Prorocentrum cordatum]
GWTIASTCGLAIQYANIGPLIYRLSRTSFEILSVAVYGILAVGVLSMASLACFWDVTTEIMGSRCCIMLMFLTFIAIAELQTGQAQRVFSLVEVLQAFSLSE